MLTLGLIGAGRMGRNYQRIFAADTEIRLDPWDPPLGIEPAWLPEWRGAIIATPTLSHYDIAQRMVARGLPVLVEKPVTAELVHADRLAAQTTCWVGHVERYNPAVAAIPVAPRFVQVERLAEWVDRGVDVDVVLDLMIHDLDLFLHRSPGDDVVDVRANGVCVATDAIDLAQARVELASGAVGTFTASRVSRKASRTWRAFAADRSYVSVDLAGKTAVRLEWDGGPRETALAIAPANALEDQVRAFAGMIRGDAPPDARLATAAQGRDALALALRVRAAIGGAR